MLTEQSSGFLAPATAEAQSQASDDRRRARRKSVFLRASIYPVDTFCDARIRDVSATGLMGETDVELAIGQTLHITTNEQSFYAGTVKWTRDRQFGLDMPQALEAFGLRTSDVDHGSCEGHHPRAPRTRLNEAARLLVGRPPRPAIVRNVSANGLLLDTSPGLKVGQHLVVRCGNAPRIYGRTQWSKDGRIGFKAQHSIAVLAVARAPD